MSKPPKGNPQGPSACSSHVADLAYTVCHPTGHSCQAITPAAELAGQCPFSLTHTPAIGLQPPLEVLGEGGVPAKPGVSWGIVEHHVRRPNRVTQHTSTTRLNASQRYITTSRQNKNRCASYVSTPSAPSCKRLSGRSQRSKTFTREMQLKPSMPSRCARA